MEEDYNNIIKSINQRINNLSVLDKKIPATSKLNINYMYIGSFIIVLFFIFASFYNVRKDDTKVKLDDNKDNLSTKGRNNLYNVLIGGVVFCCIIVFVLVFF